MVSRRRFISIAPVVALSGCVRSADQRIVETPHDSDGDGIPDENDDFPSNDRYSYLVTSNSETIRLQAGELKAYQFSVDAASDLYYQVRTTDGNRIDVFVTDESNYEAYTQRSKWNYYEDGSELQTIAVERTFTVGNERTYYLVIDNSQEGAATPSNKNNTVTAEITIKVRRLS
jgi:hypothetical protein